MRKRKSTPHPPMTTPHNSTRPTHPPPVVRHQDRRVRDVAHQVVERPVVRERLVPAVVADDEERPEHRALRDPVERPRPPGVNRKRGRGEPSDDGEVPGQVGHRLGGVLLEAPGRDRCLDVGEREGRRRGEGDLGLQRGGRRREEEEVDWLVGQFFIRFGFGAEGSGGGWRMNGGVERELSPLPQRGGGRERGRGARLEETGRKKKARFFVLPPSTLSPSGRKEKKREVHGERERIKRALPAALARSASSSLAAAVIPVAGASVRSVMASGLKRRSTSTE